MILKKYKKALTLVELMVVILIISILIALSSHQYNKIIQNNHTQTVENDLAGWMSELNQYIEDYGPLRIEQSFATREEYENHLCYGGQPDEEELVLLTDEFAPNAPLYILQSYCTHAFTLDTNQPNNADAQYIILSTKSKKDPWTQNYRIICDTQSGTIIVASMGPDNKIGVTGQFSDYGEGNFGDDIVLVVQPKE